MPPTLLLRLVLPALSTGNFLSLSSSVAAVP
jgi:hypothetical protein